MIPTRHNDMNKLVLMALQSKLMHGWHMLAVLVEV